MMNTNKKTPKLRFKGFTDDWEQRKLGECIDSFAYGLNAAAKEYDGMHKYIRITDIDDETHNFIQSNLTSPDIDFNMDVSDYKLNVGDIVFARTGASVGKTYLYTPNDCDLYYAGFLIRGRVKESCDAGFIYQNTLTKDYESFIRITSQRSGQPGVNSKEYATFSLNIPCKDEQEKISKVLNSLDKLFTLHQRKLEKLKLNKSALLQKLFPQKGCTIPDVRFKGFTDAWEQRKLNDFGIATGGTSIESEFVDGGTYKVINIGSYSEESVYNDQGLRVNKTDKTKSRILNKYDLTMILNDKTASGNIIGRVLLIDQDNTYVYNQRTERIEVDTKNFLPMFLYHMLNAPEQRKYIVKASQGNTQIYVNWSTISNIDYMIPQLLLEQEKIANLFSLINKDITLHQRKLDCLISIKKGLLQQLFV